METHIRLAGYDPDSIVNGSGYRFVFYTQGCPHHCPGCHNPQTHAYVEGSLIEIQKCINLMKRMKQIKPLVCGITFSGGEPFIQAEACYRIGVAAIENGLNIWCYTGYVYEDLKKMKNEYVHKLLEITDVLIDGPYIEAERDLDLRFRGSRNQRIIFLNKGEIDHVEN